MFDVAQIYGVGPQRLTPEEAEYLATRCFLNHNHVANEPQPAVFWVRMTGDFSA